VFNTSLKIAADYELMLRFLEKYNIKPVYIPEILVKMGTRGNSNKNLLNYLKGLKEICDSWNINNLKTNKLYIVIGRMLFFLSQHLRK